MARNTATAKNKLPVFGDNAEIDNSIVADTSGLRNTGFQYNTTIKSPEMNTYLKMLINGMSGLIDSVYDSGVSQGEIKATSTSDEIKNYIKLGLNNIIKSTTVDTAVHADEATNVDAITNNDDGDNANVKFTIGDQSFSKTVNNVVNATKATALDSIDVGNSNKPVYFASGKPVVTTALSLDDGVKLGSSTYSVEKASFWSMWYKYNPDFISIEGVSVAITKDKWVNGLFKTNTVLKNKGYKVNDFILLVGESSNSWSTFGFLKISALNDSDTYFVGMIYSILSNNSGSGSIYRISSFKDANTSFGIPILLDN